MLVCLALCGKKPPLGRTSVCRPTSGLIIMEQGKELVREFVSYLKETKKAKVNDTLQPSTVAVYAAHIAPHVAALSRLHTRKELLLYSNHALDGAGSPKRAAFSRYLQWRGLKRRHLKMLEPASPSRLSLRRLQEKVLSIGQVRDLVTYTESLLFKTAYACLYDTACRRHEILSARISDVQLAVKENKAAFTAIHVRGKGGMRRTVYLGKSTATLLESYLALSHPMHGDLKPDTLLFPMLREDSKPFRQPDVAFYKRFVRDCQKILGQPYHPHCLRHSRLTHMADNGAEFLGLRAYAGHQSDETLRYVKISSFQGKRAFQEYAKDIFS